MDQTATSQGMRAAKWIAEEASMLMELIEGNYANYFIATRCPLHRLAKPTHGQVH